MESTTAKATQIIAIETTSIKIDPITFTRVDSSTTAPTSHVI